MHSILVEIAFHILIKITIRRLTESVRKPINRLRILRNTFVVLQELLLSLLKLPLFPLLYLVKFSFEFTLSSLSCLDHLLEERVDLL